MVVVTAEVVVAGDSLVDSLADSLEDSLDCAAELVVPLSPAGPVLVLSPGATLEVVVSAGGVLMLVLVSCAGPVLVLPPGATLEVVVWAGGVLPLDWLDWPPGVVVDETCAAEVVVVVPWAVEVVVFLVVVLGGLVLEAVLQSNEMVGTLMLQLGLGLLGWGGKTMVTFLAPPHWLLTTVVPEERQELRCLQDEPSGMS